MKTYVTDLGIKSLYVNLLCSAIGKSQLFRNWLSLFGEYLWYATPSHPHLYLDGYELILPNHITKEGNDEAV